MTQLHPDCFMLKMPDNESIPCSASLIDVHLVGGAADLLDPELVRNAARAVLHYFEVERGQSCVSVQEFFRTLAVVLRGFGIPVDSGEAGPSATRIRETDLRELVWESGDGFELAFFPRLRDELRQQLDRSPQFVRFKGLRSCVKQLAGARRWSDRCQRLNDQIVDYLRQCLNNDSSAKRCSLVVL